MHLETAANLCDKGRPRNNFSQFGLVHAFDLSSITKHLITGPTGNTEGPGETKLPVSLGTSLLVLALPALNRRKHMKKLPERFPFHRKRSLLFSAARHLHAGVGNITFTGER